MEWQVWLPFPVSTNNLFGQAMVKGRMRRFPTKAYRIWRKEAELRILAARLPRFTVPVVVKLELTPRDQRPRDADNFSKAILDALVRMRVLVDDSNRYVKAVIPYWTDGVFFNRAGVVVTIREASTNAQGHKPETAVEAELRSDLEGAPTAAE